jgi:hypothetical protein
VDAAEQQSDGTDELHDAAHVATAGILVGVVDPQPANGTPMRSTAAAVSRRALRCYFGRAMRTAPV